MTADSWQQMTIKLATIFSAPRHHLTQDILLLCTQYIATRAVVVIDLYMYKIGTLLRYLMYMYVCVEHITHCCPDLTSLCVCLHLLKGVSPSF